jgi:putative DNA methylase
MTLTYKKKLIEVAIPLEVINAASTREKSIRHGHPSTLHLWWARRPLAACRAVLFAQLVDDPSSLPEQFPTTELQDTERKRLFSIMEELVKWENSTNEEVLGRARAEVLRSCNGIMPPVYDPFSGGGSIPLEAQRLGLPAYGSDLNPVAVMIGKAMIEIPPKFKDMSPIHPGIKERIHYRNAEGLAEDVKYYSEWMRERAWERIGHLYPQVDLPKDIGGGKATVIAWIWARTVPSPDPAFSDVQVPLTSSFVLSSKPGREVWLKPTLNKTTKQISFQVKRVGTKSDIDEAKKGTKLGQAMFRCILSDAPISGDYADRAAANGQMGEVLLAVVAESKSGRIYLDPSVAKTDEAIAAANIELTKLDLSHLDVPCRGTFASNAQGRRYKFQTFRDYFSERQLTALGTFSDLLTEVRSKIASDCVTSGLSNDNLALCDGGLKARAYADAVSIYLGFAVNRLADRCATICGWDSSRDTIRNVFARQAIAMTWDFAEGNPFSDSSGNWISCGDWISKVIGAFVPASVGSEVQHDAQSAPFPVGAVVSTDPPYYDNIEYADLSDFFYVWSKKSLSNIEPELFGVISTPKAEELVATRYRHGGQSAADNFFLNGMRRAIINMAQQSSADFPATIYYAFKQSEIAQEGISSTGWATFLQAVIEAGYAIVGTWPMRTEMANRMIASGTNALANSVVLVCRKKEASAETITRAEFIRALKRELPSAIKELQAANIAPADMPQSAIGPGMGVFSRYRTVLESDDSPMSVKAALQLINRELDEYLGGIQGEFDGDTRFAITWFEQNGLKSGEYGTANSIAQARGISVESVKHAGIVESQAGRVRILRRDELDDKWDPTTDQHLTIWECLQHLVRLHEKDGLSHATAVLMKNIGDKAEAVKDLAYILYDISANKRQDAKEATAYNALIADWTELSRLAAKGSVSNLSDQMKLRI